MRIGYADPPYVGCAHLYADQPDFGGEVDHAEASALTARRDGERDGLLKAADLIDARERDAHAEAALRAQDGDRAGDMHWCAKSLALNQAAKTLRALASTVPGGEEPS